MSREDVQLGRRSATSLVLVCQVGLFIGQFIYSGVIARLVAPQAVGSFATASAVFGLINLTAVAGLATSLLGHPTIDTQQVRTHRILGTGLGTIGTALGAVLFFALPASSSFISLGAMCGLLSLQCPIASLLAIESALLRRQGKVATEATIQLSSILASYLIAALVVAHYEQPVFLALAPVLSGLFALPLCRLRRQPVAASQAPLARGQVRRAAHTVRRVLVQNTGFYALNQAPLLAVSAGLGVGPAGYFSRASVLTAGPASTLLSALLKILQPRWTVDLRSAAASGRLQVCVLLATASLFGLIFTQSTALVNIWLGPGWADVATVSKFFCLYSVFYMAFALLANRAETHGEFAPARWAQLSMAMILFGGLAIGVAANSLVAISGAVAIAQVAGWVIMAVICWRRKELQLPVDRRLIVKAFALVATGVAFSYAANRVAIATLTAQLGPYGSSCIAIVMGVVVATPFLLVVAKQIKLLFNDRRTA